MRRSEATRSAKAGKPAGKSKAGAPAVAIPDKLYFRIGEVARLLDLAPYVLRFWESEFPQLKPNKGGTGQRLYRRRDVEAVAEIRHLLYDEGYTIPGARQFLKDRSRAPAPELPLPAADNEANWRGAAQLRRVQTELREIARILEQPPRPAPGAATPPTAACTCRPAAGRPTYRCHYSPYRQRSRNKLHGDARAVRSQPIGDTFAETQHGASSNASGQQPEHIQLTLTAFIGTYLHPGTSAWSFAVLWEVRSLLRKPRIGIGPTSLPSNPRSLGLR